MVRILSADCVYVYLSDFPDVLLTKELYIFTHDSRIVGGPEKSCRSITACVRNVASLWWTKNTKNIKWIREVDKPSG